jgi:hypothetical protein
MIVRGVGDCAIRAASSKRRTWTDEWSVTKKEGWTRIWSGSTENAFAMIKSIYIDATYDGITQPPDFPLGMKRSYTRCTCKGYQSFVLTFLRRFEAELCGLAVHKFIRLLLYKRILESLRWKLLPVHQSKYCLPQPGMIDNDRWQCEVRFVIQSHIGSASLTTVCPISVQMVFA